MDRVNTYSVNQIVTSAQLNEIQDNAVGGITPPLGNLNGANPGERLVHFESTTDLADNDLVTVDSRNWKDFVVNYFFYDNPTANGAIGDTDDYAWGDAGAGVTVGIAYLGLGATDGAGNQVVPLSPPLGAAGTSWAPRIKAGLWIYADPFDNYKLKLYNDTGNTIGTPYIRVSGTKTNKR